MALIMDQQIHGDQPDAINMTAEWNFQFQMQYIPINIFPDNQLLKSHSDRNYRGQPKTLLNRNNITYDYNISHFIKSSRIDT